MNNSNDHATLIMVNHCGSLVPIDLDELYHSVRRISQNETFVGISGSTMDEIMKLSEQLRIKKCLRIYHLMHPNHDIDHAGYMGYHHEMKCAVYLSVNTPPVDLWDVALIVNQDELIRLVRSVKHVRTQIKGYENELHWYHCQV